MTPNQLRRFEAKVERVTESGCWIWMAAITSGGYGLVKQDKRQRLTHRVAYEHWRGVIPLGQPLDHLCRVRCCVNPRHLEVVTARENSLRSETSLAAVNARKTECLNGHELVGDNLDPYHLARGERRCKQCSRARWMAGYYRRKATA
jgi:hypothetical protein